MTNRCWVARTCRLAVSQDDRQVLSSTHLQAGDGELSDQFDDVCVVVNLDQFTQLIVWLEASQQTTELVIVTCVWQALQINRRQNSWQLPASDRLYRSTDNRTCDSYLHLTGSTHAQRDKSLIASLTHTHTWRGQSLAGAVRTRAVRVVAIQTGLNLRVQNRLNPEVNLGQVWEHTAEDNDWVNFTPNHHSSDKKGEGSEAAEESDWWVVAIGEMSFVLLMQQAAAVTEQQPHVSLHSWVINKIPSTATTYDKPSPTDLWIFQYFFYPGYELIEKLGSLCVVKQRPTDWRHLHQTRQRLQCTAVNKSHLHQRNSFDANIQTAIIYKTFSAF